MIPTAPHLVRVVLDPGGRSITALVESLDVTNDMLELADPFSFTLPFSAEAWAATKPDTEVQVWIDEARILTGYIDDRTRRVSRSEGVSILVEGRDKGGRLIDESAPLQTYAGLGIEDLAREIVAPWFESVSLSNARNRRLIRGPAARKASVSSEPPILTGKDISRKVEPGDSRAAVLLHFLEEAELLAWSSADGNEFIVGRPNYAQAPQWFFLLPRPDGPRAGEVNVEEVDYKESIAERYAMVTVCGAGRGDASNYGAQVTKWTASAYDNPATADGTGGDFQRAKRLRIADNDIKSAAKAKARAERELRLLQAGGRSLDLVAPGYGQSPPDRATTIFCCDTMARWEDEELGLREDWFVTRVQFHHSKQGGQATRLALVPKGTELRIG
jgi:prophage tail gpP-like protein